MTAPFGVPLVGNDWTALEGAVPPPRSVSVIVAHFDQQPQLDRTLAALQRQSHPAGLLEIIVADDGSPEPPRAPAGVTIVRHEDRGFRLAAVRNLGARRATGDVLCFLDADTTPEPDFVARIARLPSLAPDVVAVGRRRHAALDGLPTDAPIELAGPEHAIAEPAWLREAYRGSRDLRDGDARAYRFVIGAVLACSRWLFDDVGGFDETFEAYGGEDWEWAHRAWQGGAALAHIPDAVAWHDGPDWAGRDAADRIRRKNDETLRLLRAIPVPGAAPRALLGPTADVHVALHRAPSIAAGVVCVDTVLQALPTARVVVPAELRTVLGDDPRVVTSPPSPTRARVDLVDAVHVDRAGADALRAAVASVGDGDVGAIALGGRALVRASRAVARDRRWGRATGWRTLERSGDGLALLPAATDLEAYLGGWFAPDDAERAARS